MKMSKRELAVLAIMRTKPNHQWTIEELAEYIYPISAERPPCWRGSIAASMRFLGVKTMHGKERVMRSSNLGRGNTATYFLCARGNKNTFLLHAS